MGAGGANIVVEAISDHERLAGADAARFEARRYHLENVRIGFAEAVLKRPDAKMWIENRQVQPGALQSVVQLAQGVGLGVRGDAKDEAPLMALSQTFSRVLGEAECAAYLHLEKNKFIELPGGQARQVGQHF